MKNPKLFFWAIALCALTFINAGCSDDDDDKKNVNPPSGNIEKVTVACNGIGDAVDHVCLAGSHFGENIWIRAEFKDNQATIELPPTHDDKHLSVITTRTPFKDHTISDKSAKIGEVEFIATKEGMAVGYFNLTDAQVLAKCTYYMYSDREVTVTGEVKTGTNTFRNINCNFRKGWNEVTTYTNVSMEKHTEIWETGVAYNRHWEYISY